MDIGIENTIHQAMNTLKQGQADKNLQQSMAAIKARTEDAKMEEVAKEYESVFLSQMLTHMFEGIETDSMFGGGQAEEVYRSMMIQEYGKAMAEAGGIGLSGALKSEMIAMQEGLSK